MDKIDKLLDVCGDPVNEALKKRIVHRNGAGQILKTQRDVLECLLHEGCVHIEHEWRTEEGEDK